MSQVRAPWILASVSLVGLALLGGRASVPRHAPAATMVRAPSEAAVPGRLVVDFRDDEPHARIAALGRSLGVTFTPASDQVDVDEIYTIDAGAEAERLLAALRQDPDVEAADFELVYTLPEPADEAVRANPSPAPEERGFPNDPQFRYQWHLEQVRVKGAWKAARGEGITVAVIDTGVARVPDLAATELVPGYNFVGNSADATDDHGHGTHVAGTIAQSTHNGLGVAGVAFRAKIMPIKVLSARGSGTVSGIAEGIRFAADHGAKVINMSLGGPLPSSVLQKAVKYAHDKGVVVVCAAGNDGRGRVSYPAAYPHAFAVAATQFDESTTFYSNWGKEIDLAAPGGNTRVDQNGDGMMDGVLQNTVVPGNPSQNDYLLFMGTSMASPHVAGVAALVASAGVTDPDKIEQILRDSARPPAGDKGRLREGPDNRYCAGLVDAAAAVRRARATTGALELAAALAAAGLVLVRLRRAGRLAGGLGVLGAIALVVGSSGLFFLPELLPNGWEVPLLFTHGLPAWDLLLGPAHHGNPLAYSALLPLSAAAILGARGRRRGIVAGLSLGIGGHLLAHALHRTMDVSLVPDMLDGAWLLLNGLVAAGIGALALRSR